MTSTAAHRSPAGEPSGEPEPPFGPGSGLRALVVRVWRRGREIELMHRAMGFAALGFVTLVPLLIVVAAASPGNSQGFGTWVREGLGVSGDAANSVQKLFASPSRVLSTTTAFSLASLAVFGLSFVLSVQNAYQRVWRLPPARWHTAWRHAVALAVLVGYCVVAAQSGIVLQDTALQPGLGITVATVGGILFFWWIQRFLLCGRISWRALLPGAVATVCGLVGLRFFSAWVFAPLIASSAVSYGPVGTVLVVESWLIGVGFVTFAGALLGQVLDEYRTERPPEVPSADGEPTKA